MVDGMCALYKVTAWKRHLNLLCIINKLNLERMLTHLKQMGILPSDVMVLPRQRPFRENIIISIMIPWCVKKLINYWKIL